MTAPDPKVSIALTVYNGAEHLADCLDSLLGQTYGDVELVVVDDGSTDDSGAILARYAAADDRVSVTRRENRGISAARNHAIEIARGEYVAFMDQDDVAVPDRIAVQAAHLDANPDIAAVGGSYAHFGYGIYSTEPCDAIEPPIEDLSERFAALPRRAYVEGHAGEATVETYSVEVRHAGPARAYFAALTDDGRRVWGRSEDPAVMDALLADEDACGRRARFGEGLVALD